ncbi:hypothetical protein THS27_22970 [Thalassospira sp. MCCC 1A01428]|nr:hypothetical protein THS27_22970 [Thalassospira sp. MCCC 1A01428]
MKLQLYLLLFALSLCRKREASDTPLTIGTLLAKWTAYLGVFYAFLSVAENGFNFDDLQILQSILSPYQNFRDGIYGPLSNMVSDTFKDFTIVYIFFGIAFFVAYKNAMKAAKTCTISYLLLYYRLRRIGHTASYSDPSSSLSLEKIIFYRKHLDATGNKDNFFSKMRITLFWPYYYWQNGIGPNSAFRKMYEPIQTIRIISRRAEEVYDTRRLKFLSKAMTGNTLKSISLF